MPIELLPFRNPVFEAWVEHVTDIKSITDKGIMFTPALVIDENIVSEGKILTVEEAKKVIK